MSKLYKNILVPLDGSELAETALADAIELAKLNQAKVILFQVVDQPDQVLYPNTGHPIYLDQQWANQRIETLKYLNEVRQRLANGSVTVEAAVEMGLVAEKIIDYARRHEIDLIVMATHGRSGLSRWVYGSVADKVLRGAEAPVLLVRVHPEKEMA